MRTFHFFIIPFLLFVWLGIIVTSCTDKKPTSENTVSLPDSILQDSLTAEDSIIAEQPMPKAADELFDDFFFNFAANRKLQKDRIVFPLEVLQNGKKTGTIERNKWRMEHFFMRQDYYTLIFNNRKQLSLVKDTTVSHVVVEKINLKKGVIKQYVFDRINGNFRMTSIGTQPLAQSSNASFLKFYERFANDTVFQIESMNSEVTFTSPNPDNDFEDQTGVILPEQWPFFKPGIIPSGEIYNIIYGTTYKESNTKIFVIRGIANGLEIEFTFKRFGNKWKLVKFNS